MHSNVWLMSSRKSRETRFEYARQNADAFRYAVKSSRQCHGFVLEALWQHGRALKVRADKLKANRETMLEAEESRTMISCLLI